MSYIKLERKMLDWKWIDVPEMVSLWIYILLKANYEANEWHDDTFEEGSFPTSISKLSDATGLTQKQVRTCLERLKNTGEIEIESNNRYSKISVCKWSEYQGNGTQKGKQKANEGQAEGNQRATLKEYKEDKKERNIYNRPSLDEVISYCNERNNGVDAQRWFNYYESNGWRVGKNPMKDWKACVRTWERNTQVRPTNKANEPDTLPVYSTAGNKTMSVDDEEELLRLMGRA